MLNCPYPHDTLLIGFQNHINYAKVQVKPPSCEMITGTRAREQMMPLIECIYVIHIFRPPQRSIADSKLNHVKPTAVQATMLSKLSDLAKETKSVRASLKKVQDNLKKQAQDQKDLAAKAAAAASAAAEAATAAAEATASTTPAQGDEETLLQT